MSDFSCDKTKSAKAKTVDPRLWTEEEKLQLAEAIDMYGVKDIVKIAARVPTKKPLFVTHKLYQLHCENRKHTECQDMKDLPFVDLKTMDDLFLNSGVSRPKEVMVKWMEYLKSFYGGDPFKYDKFKLFSSAFLIMSECSVPPATSTNNEIDFRKLYYFLYRLFNKYYMPKQRNDIQIKVYLQELFLRVLEEIKYTSENEKIAMYDIVSNWTCTNRENSLKVYGKTEPKSEVEFQVKENQTNANLKTEFKVLQHPMIPSFNPFHMKSTNTKTNFKIE